MTEASIKELLVRLDTRQEAMGKTISRIDGHVTSLYKRTDGHGNRLTHLEAECENLEKTIDSKPDLIKWTMINVGVISSLLALFKWVIP